MIALVNVVSRDVPGPLFGLIETTYGSDGPSVFIMLRNELTVAVSGYEYIGM